MPESIVFLSPSKNDDNNAKILKSITPYFYWCSAHEFDSTYSDNKFLFQYQIYFIENKNLIPGEVVQKWFSNKSNIKISIIDFIEKWNEHKRILIDPNSKDKNEISETKADLPFNKENYCSFSKFAKFVAESILNLKNIYIQKCDEKNFDFLQKKFWQTMAEYYQDIILSIDYKKNSNTDNKVKSKKNVKGKSAKKNETIRNKKSK